MWQKAKKSVLINLYQLFARIFYSAPSDFPAIVVAKEISLKDFSAHIPRNLEWNKFPFSKKKITQISEERKSIKNIFLVPKKKL